MEEEDELYVLNAEHDVRYPYVLLREFQIRLEDGMEIKDIVSNLKEIIPALAENLAILGRQKSKLEAQEAEREEQDKMFLLYIDTELSDDLFFDRPDCNDYYINKGIKLCKKKFKEIKGMK